MGNRTVRQGQSGNPSGTFRSLARTHPLFSLAGTRSRPPPLRFRLDARSGPSVGATLPEGPVIRGARDPIPVDAMEQRLLRKGAGPLLPLRCSRRVGSATRTHPPHRRLNDDSGHKVRTSSRGDESRDLNQIRRGTAFLPGWELVESRAATPSSPVSGLTRPLRLPTL
ncbi:hypothetical protein BHE74_00017475 [Ensete ventricosum]|nr:hypothetical protein GW17_00038773 [Ensete ventricosum]RWW74575.1 hypothetical protein BHE74_00017475 [Ensete ventricosum]RZS17361.1 hypothetical protein BHM03_00049497 [Ensete ventricosum]